MNLRTLDRGSPGRATGDQLGIILEGFRDHLPLLEPHATAHGDRRGQAAAIPGEFRPVHDPRPSGLRDGPVHVRTGAASERGGADVPGRLPGAWCLGWFHGHCGFKIESVAPARTRNVGGEDGRRALFGQSQGEGHDDRQGGLLHGRIFEGSRRSTPSLSPGAFLTGGANSRLPRVAGGVPATSLNAPPAATLASAKTTPRRLHLVWG